MPDDLINEIRPIIGNEYEINSGESDRFNQELAEWLKPSEKIVHQTGLHLINTRLWLDDLSKKYDRKVSIGSVPQSEWSDLFQKYEAFWFMGIYKPSEASRERASTHPDSLKDLRKTLPNLDPQKDVAASPFAIPSYEPNPVIARDWSEWDTMVSMLHSQNKKVIIDFVPNHVAVDHPWVFDHPEYFIQATAEQYMKDPEAYTKTVSGDGNVLYLAHGKESQSNFWADTLQLNYANPGLQDQMESILLELADHSDGVRCDMAMLQNPETFLRIWGDHLTNEERAYISDNRFWQKAISKVKEKAAIEGREFDFIAEAYWDTGPLENDFDFIYRKELYDDLYKFMVKHELSAQDIRNNLTYIFSKKHFRHVLFIENHDEERAVKVFGRERAKAAAALTGFIPDSIFLVHQGQEEGWETRIPMQLNHFLDEPVDEDSVNFYNRLLALKHSKLFQQGEWSLYDINSDNSNLISLHVRARSNNLHSGEREINAVICINLREYAAAGLVQDIEKDLKVQVFNLNRGNYEENIDNERNGGLFVELAPYETQIVFYES